MLDSRGMGEKKRNGVYVSLYTHVRIYSYQRENVLITTTILISAIAYMVMAGIYNLPSPLPS